MMQIKHGCPNGEGSKIARSDMVPETIDMPSLYLWGWMPRAKRDREGVKGAEGRG